MKWPTGFVFHPDFLEHRIEGVDHPERPERLSAILAKIIESGLINEVKNIAPVPHDTKWIERVHPRDYINRVRNSCLQAPAFLDPDTYINRKSCDVAELAVSAVLTACDRVMEKQVRNAFCAVRPPGHHAEKNRAMGFCIFNNVAVAARYLQEKYSLSRILIVDWDVHHGNGTQDIFYEDPSVMYFSVHEYPYYPGTGSREEKGRGDGYGTTLNVPLRAGSGDHEVISAFKEILLPAALTFKPDFILISAGFDAHEKDPIASLNMTVDGYGEITSIVNELAMKLCEGRIVSVLEGGYDLAALGTCVERHLYRLMDDCTW